MRLNIAIIDHGFANIGSLKNTLKFLNFDVCQISDSSYLSNVQNIDGHNLDDIRRALAQTTHQNGNPHAIVCHTIKGKGFPFAEQNPYWHHKAKLSPEEISQMYQCVSGTSTNA